MPAENFGTRIERKLMAHYINVNFTTPAWERLGKDLEEFNIEMNMDAEDQKNILGEVNPLLSGYAPTASVEPYYARQGTALYTWLQEVIDERKVLDDLKVETLEVHIWTDATNLTTCTAYKEIAFVEPVSYGGDTTGYQLPFNLHYTGIRTAGTFNVSTRAFTEASE